MVDESGEAYAYTGDDPVNGVDPSGLAWYDLYDHDIPALTALGIAQALQNADSFGQLEDLLDVGGPIGDIVVTGLTVAADQYSAELKTVAQAALYGSTHGRARTTPWVNITFTIWGEAIFTEVLTPFHSIKKALPGRGKITARFAVFSDQGSYSAGPVASCLEPLT